MSNVISWSYSAQKTFTNCPRRYNEVNRLKRVKDESFAASSGVDIHAMFENAIKHKTPMPPAYAHLQPIANALDAIPGEKLTEHKMAFTPQMQKSSWFDKGTWLRYAADLLILNKSVARIADYKTGKSAAYADTEQLKLGALCVFTERPEIQTVKGALIFTAANKLIPATYTRDKCAQYWAPFMQTYGQIIKSVEADKWVPRSSGLCKTCPVKSCEYNKGV
jgi:hypothetical protein